MPMRPTMRVTDDPGRSAGILYVASAILAVFSLLYVPSRLVAPGDAARTAGNILASETLYRLSIACGLVSAVLFLYLVRALYRLLRGIDHGRALWMVVLVIVFIAAGLALTVNDIAVLVVLRSGDILAAFDESQREALAMLFLRLSAEGIPLVMIFWGLWLFPFGVLVMRSGFLPRVLGVLLIVNGVAYVVASLAHLLLPDYAELLDRVLLPAELGEIWIMLWLVIRGARAPSAAPATAPALG